MPCYDDRNSPTNVAAETRRESQAHINKLTRMLCEAMKLVEAEYSDYWEGTKELKDWWKNHKKVDKKREKK